MKRGLESAGQAAAEGDVEGTAGTDAADAADEPPCKKKSTGKSDRKRTLWKGYEEERATFSTIAVALGSSGESRPINALDDCLAALNFIAQKLEAKGAVQANDPTLLASYAFCLGLFFEFSWQGRVSVNGKDFRQYSQLRTELQQCMLDANEVLQTTGQSDEKTAGRGKQSGKQQATVTPLELAEMLCSNFHSQPVTKVVWNAEDAEESILKNVAIVMMENRQDVVEPLTTFVKTKMHLPMMMHPAPLAALQAISDLPHDPQRQLVDILSIIFDVLSEKLPPVWCGFAFDCAAAHASHGHFVENTQQAWGGWGGVWHEFHT